jgi:hypothetical protein
MVRCEPIPMRIEQAVAHQGSTFTLNLPEAP